MSFLWFFDFDLYISFEIWLEGDVFEGIFFIWSCLKLEFLSNDVLLRAPNYQASARSMVTRYDKDNNGYSIDKPEEFLSQRAIERRCRRRPSGNPLNVGLIES